MSNAPIFLDMETFPVLARPEYPPAPIGVGVLGMGRAKWLGWGAPSGNNATKSEGRALIRDAYRSGRPIVMHHAQFDVDVIEKHLGLKIPPWHQLRCTLIEGFLHDPNQKHLDLKFLAKLHLGEEPVERDALHEWIKQNVPGSKRKKRLGEYYYLAPGQLTGEYCLMDLRFTKGLYGFFAPTRAAMPDAYERERKLISILLDVERQGTPISSRIRPALKQWESNLLEIDGFIRRRLNAPNLDLDSKEDIANAFEKVDLVDEWILTATGRRSVAWAALMEVCTDARVTHLFRYRSKLTNAIRTFARPWVEQIEQTDSRALCHWNSTPRPKDESGKGTLGARTGRLSSNPNWQNVQRAPGLLVSNVAAARRAKKLGIDFTFVPSKFMAPQYSLPFLRDFVEAPRGMSLLNRDYSQQELRALAHYVRGRLLARYAEDPFLDFHSMMQRILNHALKANWSRTHMKNTGFGVIYTMGKELFAERVGIEDVKVASELRAKYKNETGMLEFEKDLKLRSKNDEPMWTWGGRRYYVEPPTWVNRQWRTFEYKMLNTLIQGTAADAIKEFMVRYYEEPKREGFVSLLVHDETVAFCESKAAKDQMRLLAACMESLEFDVPMITDGKVSSTSWATAKNTNKVEKAWRATDSGRVTHATRRRRRQAVPYNYKHGLSADSAPTSNALPKLGTSSSKKDRPLTTKAWREVADSMRSPRHTLRPTGANRSSTKT